MIKVFGKDGCSRCEDLIKHLDTNGKNYEYIKDITELRIAASKARVMAAPVVEYNGNFYSMDKFLEEVK